MDWVEEVHRVTKTFPKEEIYGYIARASLSELEAHVEIARRLQSMPDGAAFLLRKQCSRIAARIHGMARK